MSTYAQQLKDPRWQKRRLEILSRADFSCEKCGDKEMTLHVHHKKYRRGAMPWEYEDHELISLCEVCHEGEHGRPRDNEERCSTPVKVPADPLVKHYIETWGKIAFAYPLVATAKCRACGNELLCGAEMENGEVTLMNCCRGPNCETLRCGDKFPAVVLSYCESWQVLL